jgi:hypothetical protein
MRQAVLFSILRDDGYFQQAQRAKINVRQKKLSLHPASFPG